MVGRLESEKKEIGRKGRGHQGSHASGKAKGLAGQGRKGFLLGGEFQRGTGKKL